MSGLKRVRNCFNDLWRYRHPGMQSFGLQRITGVLLALYLIPHILVNSSALWGGKSSYDKLTFSIQGGLFSYLELLIILGVTFHLANGLRIILTDFFNLSRFHKLLLWGAVIFIIGAMTYSIWFYWPRLTGEAL